MENKTNKCTIRLSEADEVRLKLLSDGLGLSKSQLLRLGLRVLELRLMPADAPEPHIKDLGDYDEFHIG